MQLLFSDLHLDAHFSWVLPQAAPRRQALREVLLKAVQVAHEETVDAMFIGGDIYEQERFSLDTGELLSSIFRGLSLLPVYGGPGNHDCYGASSLYRQVGWDSNVDVFASDSLQPVEVDDGFTLWGLTHQIPANTDRERHGWPAAFHIPKSAAEVAQPALKVPEWCPTYGRALRNGEQQ